MRTSLHRTRYEPDVCVHVTDTSGVDVMSTHISGRQAVRRGFARTLRPRTSCRREIDAQIRLASGATGIWTHISAAQAVRGGLVRPRRPRKSYAADLYVHAGRAGLAGGI